MCSSNSNKVWRSRRDKARSKGVLRVISFALISAPCSINNGAIAGGAFNDARCKGVV